MKLLKAICLVLLIASGSTLAQETNSHHCVVNVADLSGNLKDETKTPTVKVIGKFDTVIREEELTTRAYRLAGTPFYVVASVFYTDESMGTEDSSDSASLELLISRTPERDLLASLRFAEAELMTNNFKVARVTTLWKIRKQRLIVMMECRDKPPADKKN